MNPSSIANTPLSTSDLTHLLKRTMYGVHPTDLTFFKNMPATEVVDYLLGTSGVRFLPLNGYNKDTYTDPTGVKLGETWVNAPYGDGVLNGKRIYSIRTWWLNMLISQPRQLEEKMILFWLNHFVTELNMVNEARYSYHYLLTLRKHAFGNFREFVRAITLQPAMLKYLNGDKNSKNAPDENFARELQELFTLGKGPNAKFTEDDVKAAARILTGYRIDGPKVTYTVNTNLHDATDKQFSAIYKNRVIKGRSTGIEQELDDLINMILEVEEVSKFICRRIYTFFVWHDITDKVEKEVIEPLAKIFRDTNYEIKPVMRALLLHPHFYDASVRGAMIKSPLDFVVGTLRHFNVQLPKDTEAVVENYLFTTLLAKVLIDLLQELGDPPSVAGWNAYYQVPSFYELWINSNTYTKRVQFIHTLLQSGYTINKERMEVFLMDFAKLLPDPGNPTALIADSVNILFQIDISEKVKTQIKKDILLSGQLSDYYWTEIWQTAVQNPSDKNNLALVNTKLKNLYKYLVSMPEYQLM